MSNVFFSNVTFRPCYIENEGGSACLGYIVGSLTLGGEEMTIKQGLKVKLNQKREFQIGAPGGYWTDESVPVDDPAREKWKSDYRFSDATYAKVKQAALAIPEVAAAVTFGQNKGASAPVNAPAQVDVAGLVADPRVANLLAALLQTALTNQSGDATLGSLVGTATPDAGSVKIG